MPTPRRSPSRTSEALNDFLASCPPQVNELALALRALILRVLPSAVEQVDPPSKIIAYRTDRTYAGLICAIAPYKAHVNLMFAQGASLTDPEHLLKGTGKRARHVRITERASIENPALRTLFETAAARTGRL
jgi:hypothetical protein